MFEIPMLTAGVSAKAPQSAGEQEATDDPGGEFSGLVSDPPHPVAGPHEAQPQSVRMTPDPSALSAQLIAVMPPNSPLSKAITPVPSASSERPEFTTPAQLLGQAASPDNRPEAVPRIAAHPDQRNGHHLSPQETLPTKSSMRSFGSPKRAATFWPLGAQVESTSVSDGLGVAASKRGLGEAAPTTSPLAVEPTQPAVGATAGTSRRQLRADRPTAAIHTRDTHRKAARVLDDAAPPLSSTVQNPPVMNRSPSAQADIPRPIPSATNIAAEHTRLDVFFGLELDAPETKAGAPASHTDQSANEIIQLTSVFDGTKIVPPETLPTELTTGPHAQSGFKLSANLSGDLNQRAQDSLQQGPQRTGLATDSRTVGTQPNAHAQPDRVEHTKSELRARDHILSPPQPSAKTAAARGTSENSPGWQTPHVAIGSAARVEAAQPRASANTEAKSAVALQGPSSALAPPELRQVISQRAIQPDLTDGDEGESQRPQLDEMLSLGEARPLPRQFGSEQIASFAAPRPQASTLPPDLSHQLAPVFDAQPGQPVELTLSPEELGKVRLTFSTDNDSMRLIVHAERPETLDLMRRHIDQLGKDFREMGYASVSFSFQGGAQDQQPHSWPDAKPDAQVDAPSTELRSLTDLAPRPTQARPLTAEGGLDLRL